LLSEKCVVLRLFWGAHRDVVDPGGQDALQVAALFQPPRVFGAAGVALQRSGTADES
jgi:hypothetical protein